MQETPQITVLTGPGNHSEKLTEALCTYGQCIEVFRYFPHFEHQVYNAQGKMVSVRKARFASKLAQYSWAICIRLNFLKKRNYHIYLSFVIYDRWAAKNASKHSKLLWAWSQTGKKTMTKFRHQNKPVILEKPMVHVNTWSTLLEKAYIKHTGQKFHSYFFCTPLRKRMLREYALAQKIVTLSEFTNQTFVQNGIESNKLSKINLYADTTLFSPAGEKEKNAFNLLFVGRIDVLKGIPELINAFRKLQAHNSKITLTLVGEVKPEVQALLDENQSGIVLVGLKNPNELANFYRAADLLVLPSVQESFGLVMLEALACGTPVLASSHTGAPDLAQHFSQVTVFDAKQENALEESLLLLCNNHQKTSIRFDPGPFTLEHYRKQVHAMANSFIQNLAV